MSSEQLADGVNPLDAELAATWDVLKGYSGRDTDLGIARRFGGAAAAYSLRDIGAMNGRVVRVRRSPEDTTDAIDDEEIFSANQVQSGALEDWVNGKLETTLPGDIATARSLHSLRKIRSGYNGNALRIRRSSDNIEVDVAFDSDDKVSASSAITNVVEEGGESGSTTATDLNGFLNNENTIDFEASSFSRVRFTRTDDQTIGGQIADKFEVNATGSNYYIYNNSFFDTNASGTSLGTSQSKQVLTFKYYVDSTESPNVNYFHLKTGSAGNSAPFNETSVINVVKDSWQTVTLTVDSGNTATGLRFYILVSNTPSSSNATTMTVGEAFYLQDIPITYSEVTAFVHTWYNQSGASTGATQNSAPRQPKIASNGTLLDYVLFEGSDTVTTPAATDQYLVDTSINFANALTLGCVSDRLTTTSNGMYPVSVSRQSATNRFFGIQEATSQSVFITRNSTSVNHFADNTSELKRFTIGRVGSGSETDAEISVFGRAFGNNNGADWGNVVGVSNQNSFVIGALGLANDTGGVATNTATFQGKVYETFAYQTDEKDELFKIASNVNNYYGLYNDENDLAGNFTVDSSGTGTNASISNESKTGFTANVVDKAGFFGADLNQAVPNGSNLYISFNANLSPSGGTAATPNFGLADSSDKTGNSTGNPLDTAVTEGFNSIIVAGTASTCDRIRFTEGNDDVSFIISDLKVSRIARNGFVETWYDQSGSGNNATQTTAGQQPKVVANGGIVKNVKGFPSLKFEFIPRTELDIGLLISNLNSVSGYVVTQKDDGDTNVMAGFTQGVSNDNSRFYLPFYTAGATPNFGYNDSASKISFGTTLTGTCNLYSVFSGDTNIEAFKNGTSVGTTALVDQAVTADTSKIGQLSNSFYLDGVISEIFITTQKLQDDAATINSNVTSYYNL